MFKNIDFYIKQDARKAYAYFFPEQECHIVTVRMNKSSFITGKLCNVHMRVFKLWLIAMLITGQNN